MTKRNELINILKAELTLLSQEILQNIHQKDTGDLYKSIRKLYEKMAAIHVLDKKIDNPDELIELVSPNKEKTLDNKPDLEEKSSIIEEDKDDNPVEKPEETGIIRDNPYQQDIKFVPKQKETVETDRVSTPVSRSSAPVKKMSIGLNDRIAFIKNLFEGDEQVYTQVIDNLNAFDDYESALKYIYTKVKPRYNNWEGKDEYEFRLIQLLELKFN